MNLKTDEAKRLLSYWEQLKGDQRLPIVTDMDLVDIAPILANTVLYEKTDDDYTFRFFGTSAVRRLGHDLTGRKISEFMDLPLGRFTMKNLNKVIAGPLVLAVEYTSKTNEGPVLELEKIMLPFGDKNGHPCSVLSLAMGTNQCDKAFTISLNEQNHENAREKILSL